MKRNRKDRPPSNPLSERDLPNNLPTTSGYEPGSRPLMVGCPPFVPPTLRRLAAKLDIPSQSSRRDRLLLNRLPAKTVKRLHRMADDLQRRQNAPDLSPTS